LLSSTRVLLIYKQTTVIVIQDGHAADGLKESQHYVLYALCFCWRGALPSDMVWEDVAFPGFHTLALWDLGSELVGCGHRAPGKRWR
jgi:hypothetical protein